MIPKIDRQESTAGANLTVTGTFDLTFNGIISGPGAITHTSSNVLTLNGANTFGGGITMTAGRALGFERPEAARFSFLLGIPAIAGAGALKLGEAAQRGEHISSDQLLTAGLTFLVGLATIAVLMRIIKYTSFLPFAIYRVLLGIALLAAIYAGVPLGAVQ